MRQIVCSFQDLAELSDHLIYGPETWQPPRAISFLGSFQAAPGEEISLTMECKESGERCSIAVQVGPGLAHNNEAFWHYIGRIKEEDRVWVEMMVAKSQTIARFRAA